MGKFFGLTIDGLLPSKAKAEVEGIATVKAEGAVSGVRATAELASEEVHDLANRVTTLEAADSKTARTGAFNVTTPEFGADPTGSADSTKAIQDAVNKAAAGGQGAVYIPAGKYKVSPPFIEMKPETLIHGDGDSTIIFVDATITPPTEKIGVFHIGSYNNRAQDPTMYRASLRDLMIKTADGSQAHQPAVPNVCGVIFNTDLGSATHDPDAVHSIRGLTIWDMHIGMAILGRDDQGMKISDVRIRGGEEMGLLVGKPSDHPEAIAGVSGGPGGADNKFLNMDVSSSNKLGGVHAGIEVHTSNCKFVNSTSWYNRRFGSFAGTQGTDRSTYYDGAGWYVKGTKNVFVSCTAQENGGHGFITQYPGCQFIGCIAESNSWHDSVKGDALVNEASGFFVCNGASDTQIISARSNNARGADKGQAYGYVLENYAKNQWVQGTADQNFSSAVMFGTNMASLGKDVVVRVGDTTLNWAAGPLSTSATDEVRALAKEIAIGIVLESQAGPTEKLGEYVVAGTGSDITMDTSAVPWGGWMIAAVSHTGGTSLTVPDGWTTLVAATEGTGRMTVLARRKGASSEKSITLTSPSGEIPHGAVFVYGTGGSPIDKWVQGTRWKRSAATPTTTTAPAVPSTEAFVLAFSAERTGLAETGAPTVDNATQIEYAAQGTNIETMWVGQVIDPSKDVTLTYENAQNLNSQAFQLAIPGPGPTGPAYVAAATNGKGGAMTNAKAVTFTASSLSSPYHREAAHLSGSGPHPLVIHLHGDGYEEYTQYNSGTANSTASKYAKVAVDNKALFILPRTPDTDSQTWWSKTNSTTWLVALIKDIKAKYNIDERRIFISGYSGGAEEVTYNLACDYHTLFKGGGAMLLGGGGAEGLIGFTGTPAADIKSDFLMRWWYGETDNGVLPSDTSIDAISASAEGEAWYKTRGFNTGRTMIPGVNHYTSEPYGPDLLRQLINESNTKYGV